MPIYLDGLALLFVLGTALVVVDSLTLVFIPEIQIQDLNFEKQKVLHAKE
jgi:hypothetical protein